MGDDASPASGVGPLGGGAAGAASPAAGPMLEVAGVSKRFGATEALRGVDVRLHEGEFVALVGPNGAGKSTLIKVLDGVVTPDRGEVRVGGGGLGVVHQDLGLVDELTVAENLFLRGRGRFWLAPGREAAATREALALVSLEDVHPLRLVGSLSLGERTMLAVAKLLIAGTRAVIVDEVTAGLHPDDARWLVQKLRDSAHRGATVLMVTHKLAEVDGIADRYVVLLDGEVRLDCPGRDTSTAAIVEMLTADRQVDEGPAPATAPRAGPVVGTLDGVRLGHVGPIDLEVRAGSVTGLTGTVGSGIHEVAYVLAGLVAPDRGSVDIRPGTTRSCVPAHRETEGLFPDDSEEFNLTAGIWRRWARSFGLLDVRAMREDCGRAAQRFAIQPADLDAPLSELSGGNQQKTILGRALLDEPDLLVLCEPTRGVDVATRWEIYAQVRRAAADGAAVLVASSDVEDLSALADRTGLLGPDGRIVTWTDASGTDALTAELL